MLHLVRVAAAQEPASTIYEGGSVRDLVPSIAGDSVYIASYASDEILEIDPATAQVTRRATVADGPSSISVDADMIAVLSRAASVVTILGPVDFSVHSLVPVSKGTNALFAVTPDRVGAINPFGAEVSLIDTRNGVVAKQVALAGALPVAGASDGSRIAVAGRAPSMVWLLDAQSLEVVASTSLPAAPRAIVSTAAGRYVVQTGSELLLIDGTTLGVVRSIEIAATSLARSPDGVTCVSEGTLRTFDAELRVVHSVALPADADVARITSTAVISWSPTLGRVWRTGEAAVLAVVNEQPSASVNVQAPPPPVADTIQAIEPIAAAAEPAPSPDAPEPAPVPDAPVPAPSALAPASTPIPPAPEAMPAPDPGAGVKYGMTIPPSRLSLSGFRPYAPRFGDPTGRSFDEALARALDLRNDPDSLLNAEYPRRLTNMEYGEQLRITEDDGRRRVEAGGGVAFDVGEVHVTAERVEAELDPLDVTLEGSPVLRRGESTLSADRIRAFETKPPEIPGLWPIVPSRLEKSAPHPLVPHGYVPPKDPARQRVGWVEMDHIAWDETDRHLTADRVRLNATTRRGTVVNPRGQAGPLYYGADELRILGPQTAEGDDFWCTTCDLPEPHYRFRVSRAELQKDDQLVVHNARLQVGQSATPLYLPRYTLALAPGERRLGTELKISGSSDLGSSVNAAQWFQATDQVDLAPRVYATTKEGTGLGFDARYNFMIDPTSTFFRSRGELRTLYTTQENGYTEWYHRQELTPNTVLLGQWEQWYERDVIKTFYRNDYENRTGPRSFLSAAHTRPEYMATATVAPSTHGFTTETEKLPELTFHLFERELGAGFYGSFDAVGGAYRTDPETIDAGRAVTVGRLSYDWNVARGFNVLPFLEVDGTYYTDTLDESGDAFRGSATLGVTVQARLQRSYPGLGHFTGFKHIVIPSATISARPDTTLDAADTPVFDALDKRPGRVRVESTLDNILLGRNEINGKVWPVARFTLYQGYDLENEAVQSNDYEVDVELRPRPAWGMRTVAEIHDVSSSSELPGEDFNRLLTYVFYDNKLDKNTMNGRLGFAFTESGPGVLNQEILYGIGYKIAKKWSVAFEHRYDFELNEFTRQSYSLRRRLHDWEIGLMVRDRQDGFDIGIEINLTDFPEIGLGL